MCVAERRRSFERRLDPLPASVAEARRVVRESLSGTRYATRTEPTLLLVSELVTNALLHAGTPLRLTGTVDSSAVRVEVHDGSRHIPVQRRYGPTAGTGRGLLLLDELADDWGITPARTGKSVWFEIRADGSRRPRRASGRGPTQQRDGDTDTVPVTFHDMPLLLHAAWQEHAEALLREYLLAHLERPGNEDPIRVHADAIDAMAVVDEQIPRLDIDVPHDRLMDDVTEPRVSAARVRVDVPTASVPNFELLDRTIEAALAMSGESSVLVPPTQPEIREFRRWLCGQVAAQATGGAPVPWRVGECADEPSAAVAEMHLETITSAHSATVAADEEMRIVAASPAALELLRYDRREDLVGRRVVAIVPERFRQAHVAGFTMYLLVGRKPLLEGPVTVPALRGDGTEAAVELTVRAERSEGRRIFVAELVPVRD